MIDLSRVRADFSSVDVTVVVVSFARVHALPELLRSLGTQRFEGSLNCIVWNNARARVDEVDEIAGRAVGLQVDVFHSSRNQFCTVRFAAASLATGRLILFCDDDVIPGSDYVARFVERHRLLSAQSAQPVALCGCGHQFDPVAIAQADAAAVWDRRDGLSFFDQDAPECEVHFMHANSLLLSRELLLAASCEAMPDPSIRLVDDYWLSFVLAHHLGARLVKIQLDEQMRFIESAYDPKIAMHLQPAIREARFLMYRHHRDSGWPV